MQQQYQKHIVQSSSQYWPNDQKFRQQLSLPLTLTLQPLQPLELNTKASFSSTHINAYRCHSCKAFINYLCVIRTKNQYDCSICGCTNRLPLEINSLAPEMMSNAYTCITSNPTYLQAQIEQTSKQTCQCENFCLYDRFEFVSGREQIICKLCRTCDQVVYQNWLKSELRLIKRQQNAINYNRIQQQNPLISSDQNKQAQQYEIQKQINTHLINQHEDFIKDTSNYFLTLPKHQKEAETILDDIISIITNSSVADSGPEQDFAFESENAFIPALQKVLNLTTNCIGKVFALSGTKHPLPGFLTIQDEPQQHRQNYTLNRKKCLPDSLSYLLSKTQMSVSIYIYNQSFINFTPLLNITKITNGQLKHYTPLSSHQFYYQFYYAVCAQTAEMGTETVLKVRHSNGIKLVTIFGQYRLFKGCNDQIELISCPSNRLYTFQFMIEGIIQQSYINIQFSILYTDANNNRVFKIITHSHRLSSNKSQILKSINYAIVNQSYLWAILHNMDLNIKARQLQITLQERCRKHIAALKAYGNDDAIKKASTYIIFTFFLMRHFIMNTKYKTAHIYDKAIETRSRLITGDISQMHTIWPVAYSINKDGYKIVDMKYSQIKNSQIAVVIDQGDYCYAYIMNDKLRNEMKKKIVNEKRAFYQVMKEYNELNSLSDICKQIQQEKSCRYVEILWLDGLQGVCVLDEQGPQGYQNFINNLLS